MLILFLVDQSCQSFSIYGGNSRALGHSIRYRMLKLMVMISREVLEKDLACGFSRLDGATQAMC
jgi:hypothetical protein